MSATSPRSPRTLRHARRHLHRAESRVGDRLARLVDRAPEGGVERFMRGPVRVVVVATIFQQMPRRIDRKRAAGLDATVRWQVEGETDGRVDVYDLVIADSRARVMRPATGAPEPRLTITLTAPELLRIASGSSDAMQAYFGGRVKLAGDIMLAAKLVSLFRVPRRAPRPA
jgi:putative sterol carrier protein